MYGTRHIRVQFLCRTPDALHWQEAGVYRTWPRRRHGDARTNLNRNYVILLVPLVHRVCCTHRPDVYKLYYQDRSGRIVIIKKGTFLLGYGPFRMPVTRKNTRCQCNKGDTLCIEPAWSLIASMKWMM